MKAPKIENILVVASTQVVNKIGKVGGDFQDILLAIRVLATCTLSQVCFLIF